MADLADAYEVPEAARRELACGAGWEGRWEASWRRDGGVAGGRVSDLGQILAGGCQPWRHFTWRAGCSADTQGEHDGGTHYEHLDTGVPVTQECADARGVAGMLTPAAVLAVASVMWEAWLP